MNVLLCSSRRPIEIGVSTRAAACRLPYTAKNPHRRALVLLISACHSAGMNLLTTTDTLTDESICVSCILYTGYDIYNIMDELHTLGIYTTRQEYTSIVDRHNELGN
jgi:hypothetical protein